MENDDTTVAKGSVVSHVTAVHSTCATDASQHTVQYSQLQSLNRQLQCRHDTLHRMYAYQCPPAQRVSAPAHAMNHYITPYILIG